LPAADAVLMLPGATSVGSSPSTIVAALRYAGAAADMITALKYRHDRMYGRVLGEVLAIRVQEHQLADMANGALRRADILVPVPLHSRRRLSRGYNQAGLIAQTAGEVLGVPVAGQALMRRRDTGSQAQLGRDARLANLSGAFMARQSLAGRRVALVDDVVTTGATLTACIAALHDADAEHIECWVVARTLLRDDQAVKGSKV